MKKITTFKQIKEIIEPIPVEKFIACSLGDSNGNSYYLGWIYRKMNKSKLFGLKNDPNDYGKDSNHTFYGVRALTEQFLKEVHCLNYTAWSVNDTSCINGYSEPVIKDRLMHMIEDGIKWENSKK